MEYASIILSPNALLTFTDLNSDIFPLFTNTYPLTRGIKVELAGVVILTIFGVISQLRLWKLIKERRETSAAQRLERERDQEREEEELGRKIEDNFQREREQWEATYGDKSSQEHDTDSPKTSTSVREKGSFRSDSVELTPLPKTGIARSASKQANVTVAVVQEDDIQVIDEAGNPVKPRQEATNRLSALTRNDSTVRPSYDGAAADRSTSAKSSVQPGAPPPPVVVPLPFKVPDEEDAKSQVSDNSSVSAVPDTEEDALPTRRSLSNRLSQLSSTRMKRISTNRVSLEPSESEVALMGTHIEHDRSSSIAATLDEADDMSLQELSQPHSPLDLESKAETPPPEVPETSKETSAGEKARPTPENHREVQETPISPSEDGEVAGQDVEIAVAGPDVTQESPSPSQSEPVQSLTASTDPKPGESQSRRTSSQSTRLRSDTVVSFVKEEGRKASNSRSTPSEVHSSGSPTEHGESVAGSFNAALPGRLSKITTSYRTNEWAKHLETAEKPELDDIGEPESPGVKVEHERPAPISEEIAPSLTVAKRNSNRVSTSSNVYRNSGFMRSSSNNSRHSQTDLQSLSRSPSVLAVGESYRPGSQMQNRSARNSATQLLAPVEAQPNTLSPPSPTSNNTLLTQRETRVRTRVTTQGFDAYSASTNSVPMAGDQEMSLAQRKRALQHQRPPSASQKWNKTNWAQVQGFDSHQPKRTTTSSQKREDLLAGWRESIRQEVTPMQRDAVDEEHRRVALVNAKRQKEMEQQQQTMVAQQRESMRHTMMRSNEMLDAHREAMRRMQAAANKHA